MTVLVKLELDIELQEWLDLPDPQAQANFIIDNLEEITETSSLEHASVMIEGIEYDYEPEGMRDGDEGDDLDDEEESDDE